MRKLCNLGSCVQNALAPAGHLRQRLMERVPHRHSMKNAGGFFGTVGQFEHDGLLGRMSTSNILVALTTSQRGPHAVIPSRSGYVMIYCPVIHHVDPHAPSPHLRGLWLPFHPPFLDGVPLQAVDGSFLDTPFWRAHSIGVSLMMVQ